ncbi:hypothetical protein HTSR_1960 [Halodesulfurarchaeum formicicum]|uniref:Uncharacterized protein n=1 Tax=Halodesulfurarchaeum formicicum TaxID=1873524 RepID=A0A1D8S6Y4_9EURY|nr:hypothetical protein [Halodesulfurarchaeum formicicum]AOW81122.1 hypothetical protein HTSR_1960 [Halodesulfurarchaeum formicicum]APE96464.1 hypothetical protein HSR6_2035 [Halodesulfurarchaeum formicicum]
MSHPHLDVLFEDEFSRFVADRLTPSIVVNAYRDRINLGIRSADESVDVFVGGLSPSDARSIAAALTEAADAVERGAQDETGATWTALEADSKG